MTLVRSDSEDFEGNMVKMTLRIVMISGFDPDNFYGQSTRPYYLGSVLSQMGVRLTHICPKRPRQAFANTKFIEIGAGSNLLQKAIIFVRIVVQTLLFRPDIIYVHQSSWMNKLGGKLASYSENPLFWICMVLPLKKRKLIQELKT